VFFSVRRLFFSCVVCFCCMRFSFFSTTPRDWLGRTSPKWSIWGRVGRKTLTQSILITRKAVARKNVAGLNSTILCSDCRQHFARCVSAARRIVEMTLQQFALFSNIAPQVWHYTITRLQTEHLESIQKRAIHIIYPFTRDMSYSNIVSSLSLPPLNPGVTNFQGHSFKTSVTHPLPSIIYFPLHVIHLSFLGSE